MPHARAVCIREPGGPEVLEVRDVEVRSASRGEALVEVAAAGLNRADLLQRRGRYPAPRGVAPDVPGLEFAGTVRAAGDAVERLRPGDRVMGIVGGGAMCTLVAASERELVSVPDGMPLDEAAAVPEAFFTAFDALVLQAGLGPGEVALVHAAASGVGLAAMQLARAVGAHPVGTTRSEAKAARCEALGFEAIATTDGRFADALHWRTGGRGADVVLDGVGGAYLAENAKALAPLGRWVIIGTLGGAKGELPLAAIMTKRIRMFGSVLRSRAAEERAALARRFEHSVLPLLADGRLRPVVDAVLPMSQVREAHERMERNDTFGKLVVRMEPGA